MAASNIQFGLVWQCIGGVLYAVIVAFTPWGAVLWFVLSR